MIEIPNSRELTANGEYFFNPGRDGLVQGRMCIVEVDVAPEDGTFGGRTVTLGYQGESGNFVAFRDGLNNALTVAEANGYQVPVPRSGILAVKVDGGGAAPKLIVSAIPLK